MMRIFVDRIRDDLSPRRVTAHIAPGHIPSERVAARLGLSPSGETDDDGERIWLRTVG